MAKDIDIVQTEVFLVRNVFFDGNMCSSSGN